MDDAVIGSFAISDAAISGNEAAAEEEEVPFYDFPIGRSKGTDYGRKDFEQLVLGKRRWR